MGKMKIRETDKAYIAGFLDGDGSIHASIEPTKELKLKFRVRVTVDFTQDIHHEGQLIYIKKKISCGFISKTFSSRKSCKLSIKRREDVIELLENLKPYVFSKRKQLILALKILSISPKKIDNLEKMSLMADKISSLNIVSRSRRKNRFIILKSLSPVTTDSRYAG